MTVQDCIDYVDSIEPNAYTNAQKTGWLNEVEGKVYTQLFLVQPYEFKQTPQTLALPAPYDRMYSRYLQAMIHYANGEYDRYANSMAMFNEVWAEANRWFGGDFDVTDRLRNREYTVAFTGTTFDIMSIPEGTSLVAGRIVIRQPFTGTLTAKISLNGTEIAEVDMTEAGSTPMPVLMGGVGGSSLSAEFTASYPIPDDGEAYVTGRLLIPAEKWYYDDKYARRRDARWLS